MRNLSRVVAVAALSGAAAGCGLYPAQTFAPYPVTNNPVNPTPVPGYRVLCRTVPNPLNALFDDYQTGCVQVLVPARDAVAIRVRG